MVKRILLSIVLLLVIAYLVVAVTAFNRKPTSQVGQDVELVIKDTEMCIRDRLKTFVQIVLPIYGFRHGGGIVHRY